MDSLLSSALWWSTVKVLHVFYRKDIPFAIRYPSYIVPSPCFAQIFTVLPFAPGTEVSASSAALKAFQIPTLMSKVLCVNRADSFNIYMLKHWGLCNQIKQPHSKISEHLFLHLYSNFINSKRVKQAQTHALYKLQYRQYCTHFVTTVMKMMPILNKIIDRLFLR